MAASSKDDSSGLNQPYYGPSIPPQQPPIAAAAATTDGCTPYTIICTLFRAFTTILIVLGIIIVILWLIYQPQNLKLYVDNATLSRFDLSPTNNTLYYNLTMDVSLRNPNNKVGVTYERLSSSAFYGGSRFDYETYPSFYQKKKNTTMLQPSFAGQGVLVGEEDVVTYKRERGEGWFYVSVRFYTRVRLRIIVANSIRYRPEADCFLRLPAPGNATSAAAGFTRTECHVGTFS